YRLGSEGAPIGSCNHAAAEQTTYGSAGASGVGNGGSGSGLIGTIAGSGGSSGGTGIMSSGGGTGPVMSVLPPPPLFPERVRSLIDLTAPALSRFRSEETPGHRQPRPRLAAAGVMG
ncbi:unnamed protein product, partial [Phaeothamnion confervicola]